MILILRRVPLPSLCEAKRRFAIASSNTWDPLPFFAGGRRWRGERSGSVRAILSGYILR